jgi:DNA-binding NarL/FixJ family response regulator
MNKTDDNEGLRSERPFCSLDRAPEAGGDERRYPAPAVQAFDMSTAIRPRTFKKRFLALTARRQEVAMMAAHGLSNRTIAKKLDLAEGTVKIHLHRIYKILHLHSKIELAMAVGKLPRVKVRFQEDRSV